MHLLFFLFYLVNYSYCDIDKKKKKVTHLPKKPGGSRHGLFHPTLVNKKQIIFKFFEDKILVSDSVI